LPGKIEHFYEFGGFRLDAENHGLWRGAKLVAIAPKALELLILLIRRDGNIVSREELLETIWRGTYVEEANINYTVSQLRKILGENSSEKTLFVQTVPKQGYRFVAEVKEIFETDRAAELAAGSPAANSSPGVSGAQIRWHFIAIILLAVLLLTSFAYWWRFNDQRGLSSVSISERNIRTVAVLPLKTLTESEHNKALSLGLTDSLISCLGGLNRFAVRPLDAVKDYTENPLGFGEELKVDAVLEGTLQQTENRLRVNLRLWDVRDGAQLWQSSFDETEADLFKLQDTISTKVTNSLVSGLLEKDRRNLTKRGTENRAAFDAFWRGRFYVEGSKPQKAAAEFQQAIDLDPNYAAAYAWLANAYSLEAQLDDGGNAALYEKARASANHALSLNPNLADAHHSLGRIKFWHDWDWAGAERSFKTAIELDPNEAIAYNFYARLLSVLGRYDEALAEIKKAREIDPRSTVLVFRHLAILERRGDFDEALKIAHAQEKTDPNDSHAVRALGSISLLAGDHAKVIELGGKLYPDLQKANPGWTSLLAAAYHKHGQPEKARAMLDQLKKFAKNNSKALYFLAMNESELGHRDEALAALEKCLETHEELLIWAKGEPRFNNLKTDPRFREIQRKMKLAD
jgi:DNA-binding winged helix-turn-helix (wHTH) protein/tetratricopeptide (TPR) repeat protein